MPVKYVPPKNSLMEQMKIPLLANSKNCMFAFIVVEFKKVYFCSVPSVKLIDGKGLSNQQVEALQSELVQLTRKLIGEVQCYPCLLIVAYSYSVYDIKLWL